MSAIDVEKTAAAVAEWHAKQARFGGVAREWHMRAETHVRTQAAAVEALADALEAVHEAFETPIRVGGLFGSMGRNVMDKVDAALRLAGRLP